MGIKEWLMNELYPYLEAFPEEDMFTSFKGREVRVSHIAYAREAIAPSDKDIYMDKNCTYILNVHGRKYCVIF